MPILSLHLLRSLVGEGRCLPVLNAVGRHQISIADDAIAVDPNSRTPHGAQTPGAPAVLTHADDDATLAVTAKVLVGDDVAKTKDESRPVSGNNPCPFLRALVSEGKLSDDREPLEKVAAVIVTTAAAGDGSPALSSGAIVGIGLVASGLSPMAMLITKMHGLRLNALRGGPLDKKGVGSRILDSRGNVDSQELARLRGFAKKKVSEEGASELGLGLPELRSYMDANFERAAGQRRLIDRTLMIGEWPVLLRVMGKEASTGRYLSLRDVEDLFTKRRLPQRMRKRLQSK